MGKEGKTSGIGMKIALGILVGIWVTLLVLMLALFVMRLNGYQTVEEWRNREETPVAGRITQTPGQAQDVPKVTSGIEKFPITTVTPEPSPTPTDEPENLPTKTPTPSPTKELTSLELLKVTGKEAIDADIRRQAATFAGDETAELAYEVFQTGVYVSVIFHKVGEFEGETMDVLLPLVYHLETEKQVTGSDLVKESYFAIIKERLQTYVKENFPAAEGTSFITYDEIYQEEDYQKIFLTEETIGFWFEANTLLPAGQKPFSYQVPLEEAEAFFYCYLDGSRNGIPIRELDPEKPMIAITFDDGPDLQKVFQNNNLDMRLVKLFQQYDGRATFFFLGNRLGYNEVDQKDYAPTYGKLAKQIYEAGFEIGSHTHTHTVNFGSGKEEQKELMWWEFNRANETIAAVTGHAPDYARLPGGAVGQLAREFPIPFVNWNKDSVDYEYKATAKGGERIAANMMKKGFQDGDIVLFHSIYQTSYDAVAILLEYLDEQGFQFVTVSELFYYKGVTPEQGVTYRKATGSR